MGAKAPRSVGITGALLALPLLLAWGCSSVSNDHRHDSDVDDLGCGVRPDAGECPDSQWSCRNGQWVYLGEPCGECPQNAPSAGDPCDLVGISCPYEAQQTECAPPGEQVTFQCTDSGWAQIGRRCTLPVECPVDMPMHGTDCSDAPNAVACVYTVESGCGPVTAYAQCRPSQPEQPVPLWNVELTSECSCSLMNDAFVCAAGGCRWLEPGCGEAQPVEAGCYEATDCTPETCGEDADCVPVSTDPCWYTGCNACDAPASVCMPYAGGA